ncbi:palmitoyl-protein thioesterase 3 [Salpingoeca rosetta]|uniref:Palmitoyl-protein thioesterase 3 n=1 Tax=Salpingoeca rosetta (strain ATCC 50818 / BSB-021) TaxID=946362 RepID=F2UIU3_SALR5|nr:palmitoyl-protein thioesterase 3 [Salpingoeca rosetta]EGD77142.1 palmitoyl-protein thioesterase 3 [Salpingoeca rosetta]|eukprot:XP_004990981.1 palmitoyl-protein thioesterase 3 [Salpingoeca rosetta]
MKLLVALAMAAVLAVFTSAPTAQAQECEYPPVVLMHGILGAAEKITAVVDWIHEAIPCAYIKNMEIGNGPLDSVFMHMNDQVDNFCEQVYADPKLARGFNLIGFSQGGLIARGYVQRCNKYPVINFLSWVSPQGGQFGGVEAFAPPWLVVLFNNAPYSDMVQNSLSLAQYWRDPFNIKAYMEKSTFLADLNNERLHKNATYKEHITSLKTMMLIYSKEDFVVNPRQSGWFQHFRAFSGPGKNGVVVPLRDSLFYKLDYIGVKALDESGRLQMHESDCAHADHPTPDCKHIFDLYSLPLLKQRWSEVEDFWSRR